MAVARMRRLTAAGPGARLLLTVLLVCSARAVAAEDLTVAAASDLQSVLPAVVARFRQETGWTASVTYGSSGNFFTQIQNGAPFEVFLSADSDYPRRLQAAALTEPDTLYVYAIGRLVVWAPVRASLDIARGLQALSAPAVRHVAIANPEHAPYGRAAVAALQHEGVYEKIRQKLVFGENIAQAAQFVQAGNADAGILALSLALAPALKDSGGYYLIPQSFHPRIEQAGVVLRSARHKEVAMKFLALLKQPDVRRLLQTYGFEAPPRSDAPSRRP
jgi:molybdate transport system substrate-binding protein